jgi:hypothetical protein
MEVDGPTTVSSPSGAMILLLLQQEKYIPIIFTRTGKNWYSSNYFFLWYRIDYSLDTRAAAMKGNLNGHHSSNTD